MIETVIPLFDDPLQWGQFIPAPADVNLRRFQRQLTRIAGRSPSGRPVMRVVWGWSSEAKVLYRGEWRARYRFMTAQLPDGNEVDLAVPRWFLEELVEPAQYREQWEALRYEVDADHREIIDVHGPAPEGGWYVPALCLAEHDKQGQCCSRMWNDNRRKCWGKYRSLGDDTLEKVRRAVQLREKAKMHNRPDEPMDPMVMQECMAMQYEAKKSHDEMMNYHIKMLVKDFVDVFGDNFTSEDPTRHKWGKYHFTAGHSKGGLSTPVQGKHIYGTNN